MVAPGKTDSDYPHSIYRFSTELAWYVYGPTEEEKKLEQEQEARQRTYAEGEEKRKAERSERMSKRAKELKDMPKQYILVYYEYKYSSWRDYEAACRVRSSAVKNQEEMVQQEVSDRKRWNCEMSVFEYCFITEEQANNILSNEPKNTHNSKKLTGINDWVAWKRLIHAYGLEVRTMKI